MGYPQNHYRLSAICIAALLLLIACTKKEQEPAPPEETGEVVEVPEAGTVSMFLDFNGVQPNKEISDIPWQSGLTVYNAMVEAQNEGEMTFMAEEDSLGHYITSIDSVAQNTTTFWLFCVNGVTSTVGVDDKVLNDGDNVEWHYTTYPPCPTLDTASETIEATARRRGQHPQFPIE